LLDFHKEFYPLPYLIIVPAGEVPAVVVVVVVGVVVVEVVGVEQVY
jgi:uncharacterized protein (DUF983 family)